MWLKYLTYAVFISSILSLWIPVKSKIKPWMILLGVSMVLAVISHIVNVIAVLSIILFYIIVSEYHKYTSKLKYFLWVSIFCLGLALELHLIPGFKNLLIWDKVQITPDAIPFTLYLNFDKTIVGLVILGLTLKMTTSRLAWSVLLKQVMLRLPVVVFIILIVTMLFGYTKFEPKLPHNLWIWALSNLLFTCIAEEGFFRGFFQESLSQLKYKYSEHIAIIVPALFFGLIHYPGGIKYVTLATIAGILYGWVYKVTKRIEASMLTHFCLNLTHILLFTYPALIPT
jgi:membrane protease YdiL (CAAX protease family)